MTFFIVTLAVFCIGIVFGVFLDKTIRQYRLSMEERKELKKVSTPSLKAELDRRLLQEEVEDIHREMKQ